MRTLFYTTVDDGVAYLHWHQNRREEKRDLLSFEEGVHYLGGQKVRITKVDGTADGEFHIWINVLYGSVFECSPYSHDGKLEKGVQNLRRLATWVIYFTDCDPEPWHHMRPRPCFLRSGSNGDTKLCTYRDVSGVSLRWFLQDKGSGVHRLVLPGFQDIRKTVGLIYDACEETVQIVSDEHVLLVDGKHFSPESVVFRSLNVQLRRFQAIDASLGVNIREAYPYNGLPDDVFTESLFVV